MGNRIPWDQDEAALLLNMLVKVQEHKISRSEAIAKTSALLRDRAIKMGFDIDDRFRNTNGIALQMMNMAKALNSQGSISSGNRMFDDLVELYFNNSGEYNKLVQESRFMVAGAGNYKDDFFNYVVARKTGIASEIFLSFDAMDSYAISTGLIETSMFMYLDDARLKIIEHMLDNDKNFIKFNGKSLVYVKIGLSLLKEYISQNGFPDYANNEVANSNDVTIVYTDKPKDNGERPTSRNAHKIEDDDFVQWMIQTRGLAHSTARNYRSMINFCDSYANKSGIYGGSILLQRVEKFNSFYAMLVNDINFKSLYEKRYNNCVAALNVCREYLLSTENIVNEKQDQSTVLNFSEDFAVIANTILEECFEDGYRIGNYLDQVSFITSCEEHGENIPCPSDELDMYLCKIGRVIDDRIYSNDDGSQSEVLDIVFGNIEDAFSNGSTVVYMDCVFDRYRKKLTSINIYNADSLYNIMANDSRMFGSYLYRKGVLTKLDVTPDIELEVENYLKASPSPLSYDDFKRQMWYLPLEKIKGELVKNSNAVNVDTGMYFYAPNFNISAKELLALIEAMDAQIYSKGYIVTAHLRELFRDNCPLAAMDSETYKDYGIREILKALLGDKFDFCGSVITRKGRTLDIGDVFRNYAADHESLTFDQIKEFADELKVNIYWNSIMREMIRVSKVYLVRKDKVNFDTDATDRVLDELCPDDYTALKDINLFLSFPDIGYKWNGYVLESYLRNYSKKFRLIQLSVSNDDYFGIMVRISSKFKGYDDVAVDMLAHRNDWNDEKSALACLVKARFQQRMSYKNISSIIKQAMRIRENII